MISGWAEQNGMTIFGTSMQKVSCIFGGAGQAPIRGPLGAYFCTAQAEQNFDFFQNIAQVKIKF
jgi:hypothetical protein